MISLGALLKLGALKNKKPQRLRLEAELATVVMQLHATKWLGVGESGTFLSFRLPYNDSWLVEEPRSVGSR